MESHHQSGRGIYRIIVLARAKFERILVENNRGQLHKGTYELGYR